MRLSLEQIKSITTGAVDVTEGNGAVRFDRFTKPQLNMYINGRRADPWHGPRAMSPAGVKLSFRTDSEYLFIRVNTRPGYTWDVFSLDVEVNGEYIGGVDSYKTQKIPPIYNGNDLSSGCGRYTGRFELPCGENLLCIHMPYNAITELEDIELSDGASIIPVIPEKIYMAYGDSITQGLHSQRPSHRYTARLAKLLGAAEYNKAIAGEIFFPQLSRMPDDLSPDYITVAYGINDWFGWEREVTVKKMNEFYKNISEMYPDSKIFAISPIWCTSVNEERKYGSFELIRDDIRNAVCNLTNVTFIDGSDLVPHACELFGDGTLHPNDDGFAYYAENLYKEIKKHI